MITTFLFGNGLGRALDDKRFDLHTAINKVWNQLDPESQKLLGYGKENNPPHKEKELEHYHNVASASSILNRLGPIFHSNWLSEEGKQFPSKYKKIILDVSLYFYNEAQGFILFDDKLSKFKNNLEGYIKNNKKGKTHIVTLNYDRMLYQILYESGFLNGYNGKLCDGFGRSGQEYLHLSLQHFEIGESIGLGYFLHLHGSPLYYTKISPQLIVKSPHNAVLNDNKVREHIVLANTKQKPSIIAQSYILSLYFEKYVQAIDESDKLVLYGYSGKDIHVNEVIKRWYINHKDKNNLFIISNNTQENNDCDWKQNYPGLPDDNIRLYKDILTDCNFDF